MSPVISKKMQKNTGNPLIKRGCAVGPDGGVPSGGGMVESSDVCASMRAIAGKIIG